MTELKIKLPTPHNCRDKDLFICFVKVNRKEMPEHEHCLMKCCICKEEDEVCMIARLSFD